jgi:N-acetylglucosaminyldiphosphoundecaprenol N-acetyl-beta-D-mannosaminyltransferase
MEKADHPRISVLGSRFSALSRAEIESRLLKEAELGRRGYVCVANVHTTMMGWADPEYRQIANESAYTVPDGMPLVWAMKSLGAPEQDRVRGPSLMRALMDKGREKGLKHYLYGGSPKAIAALQEMLHRDYPGVKIVGAESPPFRALDLIQPAEFLVIAERIHASGAQVLWVGLGAPKQEQWMWMQCNNLALMQLGVGAAFDLLPGLVPEAPAFLQSMGLEWLYRLYREPARLWRRYLWNNPAFLVLWGCQWLRHCLGFGRKS